MLWYYRLFSWIIDVIIFPLVLMNNWCYNITACSHDGAHRPSSRHSLLDCIQNPQGIISSHVYIEDRSNLFMSRPIKNYLFLVSSIVTRWLSYIWPMSIWCLWFNQIYFGLNAPCAAPPPPPPPCSDKRDSNVVLVSFRRKNAPAPCSFLYRTVYLVSSFLHIPQVGILWK